MRNMSADSEHGITLIEIVLVITILAMTMAIATPMISGVTLADLKTGAGQVASAVRYTFDMSSMTGRYCRLSFELQSTGYKVECADKPFYMGKRLESANADGERVENEEDETRRFSSDEEEKKERERLKPNFREVKTMLLRKASLPSDVRFDGIMTSHQAERFTKGTGYLYFFPGGYTERAYINLADDNAHIFTVVVSPLTGRAVVNNGYVEPEKWTGK
ncbi:MAG: prepilin-type N-terminal cleavage/methylation domain-containing protein [Myxococcota bacterium]|jgi:general secretion pathway protein H